MEIEICSENLTSIKDISILFNTDDHEFYGEPGKEHYRLLSYLASCFKNSDIFDIGTHRGASALALSYEPTNTVYSFDIENRKKIYDNKPHNVNFVISNLFEKEGEEWNQKLLNSPLIFLDIDPHDGLLEYDFYMFLVQNDYKGIIIFDDILHFEGMRIFWDKINPSHRRNITEYGHWSGTGMIDFSGKVAINRFSTEIQSKPKNWTLVTAYFDLTKCEDASSEIKERDGDYYLKHSTGCLSLDYNMIIYFDPEFEEKIRAHRPAHLHYKTTFIPISFEDMKLTKHRKTILNNRKTRASHDPRNTASYYLLCMARYDAIKRAIETNPYQSTHFAWINICIERMGPSNLIELPNALSLFRDKFSTCYIDYIPPHFTCHLSDYYIYGRCSMCSGFFTGRADYFYEFCNKIENVFLEFLEKGYGHADEQLFLAVYYRFPWLFEFYYGDYQQMITNYVTSNEKCEFTLDLLIKKSFEDRNWYVCYDACRFLWRTFKNKVLASFYFRSAMKIGKTKECSDVIGPILISQINL